MRETKPRERLAAMLVRVERDYVANALARTGGNVAAAARDLGMPLSTLWFKVKRFGINPGKYRTAGGLV